MFDTRLRAIIDPPLNLMARRLAASGLTANQLSLFGLALALCAGAAVVAGVFWLALILILLNRLADGLDGSLARVSGATELGGFYDIVFDFLFYGLVPLAFALYAPQDNALPAALLLASFYANGATFLAFAAIAARTGRQTSAQGQKTIYYFAGVAEGAETIAVFCAMCVFPGAFGVIATLFAVVCFVSAAARIVMVRQLLSQEGDG
ncbi:MAG: CDP-alcohol phosphatidyltransferase family protein [Pseudomonadota bacterium]